MSKIGKISISIPDKVKVALAGSILNIEGPLGKTALNIDLNIFNLDIKDGKEIFIKPKKSDQNTQIFLDQKRFISADINGIRIINVYVPNGSSLESDKFEYKIKWLNCLASFLDEQEKKGQLICLLGDFNIAPSNLDLSLIHI